MALNLLRTRGAAVIFSRPALTSCQRAVIVPGVRKYTTAKDDKPIEPKQKALSIIDSLPGNNIISKTGYITVSAGLLTYIISKELYVFNEETFIAIAFGGMSLIVYRGLKEPLTGYFEEKSNKIISTLRKARENHTIAVKDRIESVSEVGEVVDVTKALFGLAKETAALEAESFELKQKVTVTAEIKSVLDSWVRYEAAVREREQRALAEAVIQRVQANLQDPKIQQQILSESITEIENIVNSKTA